MKQTIELFKPDSFSERSFIKCIWKSTKSDFETEQEIILPKGNAEIIFNLGNDVFYCSLINKSVDKMPQCMINGINTIPHTLIKNKNQSFIGIQLYPFALNYLFNTPVVYFTNRVVNGFDVCTSLKVLFERLKTCNFFDDQVLIILSWLKLLSDSSQSRNNHKKFFDLVDNTAIDNLKCKKIHSLCNLSDRHLRRLSCHFFGMSLEQYILYRMYLNSMMAIHDLNKSLTFIAHDNGFYDQSHFIRCFKTFTGLTPGEYRRKMSEMPGHIYNKDQSLMSV